MATRVHYGMIDHSGEPCGVTLYFPTLTAANFDSIMALTTGKIALVGAALVLATRCGFTKTTVMIETDAGDVDLPSVQTAQREHGIRALLRDSVNGKPSTMFVPGPKSTVMPTAGSDDINLENVIVAAVVAFIEGQLKSEDGNALSVIGAHYAGRNR